MLVSRTARGRIWRRAAGTVASSTSNRPTSARGQPARSVWATMADTRPVTRLAPARLWRARSSACLRMCEIRRVVVVLPLVPETRTEPWRSRLVTVRRAVGSIRGTTCPAMTVPPPRPSRRLRPVAMRPASSAAVRRAPIEPASDPHSASPARDDIRATAALVRVGGLVAPLYGRRCDSTGCRIGERGGQGGRLRFEATTERSLAQVVMLCLVWVVAHALIGALLQLGESPDWPLRYGHWGVIAFIVQGPLLVWWLTAWQ